MSRKCQWAERGPMDSAQLTQWTEVHQTSMDYPPLVQKGQWASVELWWAETPLEAHQHLVRSNRLQKNAGHRSAPQARALVVVPPGGDSEVDTKKGARGRLKSDLGRGEVQQLRATHLGAHARRAARGSARPATTHAASWCTSQLGSAMGCTWLGCHRVREPLQEEKPLGTKASSEERKARRATFNTEPRQRRAKPLANGDGVSTVRPWPWALGCAWRGCHGVREHLQER
jgi:hypothetical protein